MFFYLLLYITEHYFWEMTCVSCAWL